MLTFRLNHAGLRRVSALLLATAFPALLLGDGYTLDWWTVDGGGAMWGAGGGFELSGTVGQPDAGSALTGGGFELTGGFWAVSAAPAACVGDVNCDGQIDFADINPFVLYLSNYDNWLTEFAGCNPVNGDINCDGSYGQDSFTDINPFVALITQCASGCNCSGPVVCP